VPRMTSSSVMLPDLDALDSNAMKSLLIKLLLGAALLGTISACNTVAGIGEDISAAGRGMTRGAEQTKQKM